MLVISDKELSDKNVKLKLFVQQVLPRNPLIMLFRSNVIPASTSSGLNATPNPLPCLLFSTMIMEYKLLAKNWLSFDRLTACPSDGYLDCVARSNNDH